MLCTKGDKLHPKTIATFENYSSYSTLCASRRAVSVRSSCTHEKCSPCDWAVASELDRMWRDAACERQTKSHSVQRIQGKGAYIEGVFSELELFREAGFVLIIRIDERTGLFDGVESSGRVLPLDENALCVFAFSVDALYLTGVGT